MPIRFDDPVFFDGPGALRSWLQENAATADQVWVGMWKVGSGKATLTWPTMVDELLSFGWIMNGYLPAVSEEWSQRSAIRTYYDQRGPDDPLLRPGRLRSVE